MILYPCRYVQVDYDHACIFYWYFVQVLTVLDYLNLKQYKDSFLTEGIDGDIFSQLDDEMLEQDLGIRCKLHRLKLLQVISGKTSVMQLASSGKH